MPRAHLLEIHCHGASGSMSEMNSPYEFTAGERYLKSLMTCLMHCLNFSKVRAYPLDFKYNLKSAVFFWNNPHHFLGYRILSK